MDNNEFDYIFKINWAHFHIQQLDQAIQDWFRDGSKFTHEIISNPEEQNTLLLRVSADIIPTSPLSLAIGDIIQNIRSSLDHAVYQLGESSGHEDFAKNSHRSQFPIFGNVSNSGNEIDGADKFQKNAINNTIKFLSPAAQNIIESVQPFKDEDKYAEHPLWLLNKLSNLDKHRCLHAGAAYAGSYTIRSCRVSGNFTTKPVLVDEKTTVTKLGSLTPINPNNSLVDLVTPKMTVCFKDEPFSHMIITDTLSKICLFVSSKILEPLHNI